MRLDAGRAARLAPAPALPVRPGGGREGAQPAAPVPIFLLTGFLGSGKTTLLRRILDDPAFADTALIINEFGAVGLDHKLVQSAVENVLLMDDGCLCCSVRGDLVDTIGDLFAKAAHGDLPSFSRIVIETTGLADPTAIVQDLVAARGLAGRASLAKVVVTVDAVLGASQLADIDEVTAQIVQADLCVVTKCDLGEIGAVDQLIGELRDINPAAEIVRSDDAGGLAVARLLAPACVRTAPARSSGRFQCDGGAACTHPPDLPCAAHPMRSGPPGERRVHGRVQTWSTRQQAPLRWEHFRRWLDLLYSSRPANMLRMKAILHLDGQERPIVVHGVGASVYPPTVLDGWRGAERISEVVVIATDLPGRSVGRLFEAVVLAPPP